MKKIVAGCLIIAGGILLILFAFAMNTFEKEILNAMSLSFSQGQMMDSVRSNTYSIIAGGKMSSFPRYFVYAFALTGAVLSYIGSFVIINRNNKGSFLFFTKDYWTIFQKSLSYEEHQFAKITLLKKRKK